VGTFQGTFFRLSYPDHWEAEIIEDIPAFFDPEGGGALQVAAGSEEGNFQTREELNRFLSRQGMEFQDEKVATFINEKGIECSICEYMREGRFWLVQALSIQNRLLLVFYNSDEIPDQEQALAISSILGSIQPLE